MSTKVEHKKYTKPKTTKRIEKEQLVEEEMMNYKKIPFTVSKVLRLIRNKKTQRNLQWGFNNN
jgi:hypothetical protein